MANEHLRTKYSDLSQLHQAENGTLYRATTETTNRGFTGASYVNFDNEVGSYIEMTVNVASAATKTLLIRYANGTSADRPLKIYINSDVVSSSLSFTPTGAWTAWRSQSISVWLDAGDNILKFGSITATGGPNVDWMALDTKSWDSYSGNYGDSGGRRNDYFDDNSTEHVVYMYGTGFSGTYKVICWDGNGDKRVAEIVSDVGGVLKSSHTFNEGLDAAGDWHVAVYTSSANPLSYSASDPNIVADDTSYTGGYAFHVEQSAIPEFPTVLAAIVALALSAGIYLWMRRKAHPVPA